MRNILVTGGAGFIGTNFVYYWLNKYTDDHIVVLDALTYAGSIQNLAAAEKNRKFEFVHGNILDCKLVATLLVQHDINTIVHFAAESHVDRSITGPDEFINTNITGTHCLLKTAKEVWIDRQSIEHRFHHVSTDEVYGTLMAKDSPFTETSPYAPNSPYAASKAASDHLVRAYYKTYGLNVTISNCSNNYGPYQFAEKLIPLVINNILRGIPLPVYGDGCQIRDWLHVDDHNQGIELILNSDKSGETYNIGGDNEKRNIDVISMICELIDKKFINNSKLCSQFPDIPCAKGEKSKSLITFVKDRKGHDRRYAIDAGKITSQLGYSPKKHFQTGLGTTIESIMDCRKNNYMPHA